MELAALVDLHTGDTARTPLVAGPRPDPIPLSPAQQRIWFLNRFDTASAADNIPLALRLRGRLDIEALRAAVHDVIERHESLRTVYPGRDGVGCQVILDASDAAPLVEPEIVDPADVPGRVSRAVTTGSTSPKKYRCASNCCRWQTASTSSCSWCTTSRPTEHPRAVRTGPRRRLLRPCCGRDSRMAATRGAVRRLHAVAASSSRSRVGLRLGCGT